MVDSGLPDEWCDCAMECYCSLRIVRDKMAHGNIAYEKRCDVKFDGPLIPFGATVSSKPISSKDEAKLHQFGKKVLPGTFMEYVSRGRGWSSDLLIADCKDLESLSKESCRSHVQTDLSNSSVFLNHHAATCLPRKP